MINAPKTNASEQEALNEQVHNQGGAPSLSLGPCWGVIESPHNSDSRPGPQYVSAKTQIRCNDILSNIGSAAITNWLYVRADSSERWQLLASNTSHCNAETVSNEVNGWVQCLKANSGRYPVMVGAVSVLCVTGTRYDYKQNAFASVTTDDQIYSGYATKTKTDVLCKGD